MTMQTERLVAMASEGGDGGSLLGPRAPLGWRGLPWLILALGVFYVGLRVVTPWWSGLIGSGGIEEPEVKRFFGHLATFSLPYALVAAGLWAVYVRLGLLAVPRLGVGARRAAVEGVAWGLGLALMTVIVWWATGGGFGWSWSSWSFAGNLFSNLYEEIAYRGLLLGATLVVFGRGWPAVLVASAVFAWTHSHYPPLLVGIVATGGLTFGVAYLRTKTLLAPWLAHVVADAILDTILVL